MAQTLRLSQSNCFGMLGLAPKSKSSSGLEGT
jgi:hypothetical protein